ncbi:MAG: WbqC family protein [Flavobacteriaceae bacterium]|nr:WbqC family protein [Flavobacteriaceae bacterium]
MISILIESHFSPSIEYFDKINDCENLLIEVYENYQKQTYRNRCYILTSQKVDKLIVPIINPHKKTIIKDIKIDNRSLWFIKHLRSIKTSYSKAPYFIYYEEKLNKIFNKKHKFLIDLNLELINLFLEILEINLNIKLTTKYNELYEQNILDYRNKIILPNKRITDFITKKYTQIFGTQFYPNLSIIDLFMSKGPSSSLYLTNN